MSDFQTIERTLKATAARHRLQRAWSGFWQGLLGGGIVWLVVFVIYKLLPIPVELLTVGAVVAGCILVAAVMFSIWRKESLLEAARWIDEKQKLQQRLSTAWEVAGKADSEWKQLVVSD